MKREREKKWYFIYGNLTERFYNWYFSENYSDLDYLLNHPKHTDVFQTTYSFSKEEYALKQKHYLEILHTVVLNFFPEFETNESLFNFDIGSETDDKQVTLIFKISAKQKDEEIFIGETVEQSDGREQPI
jgi:hypothetical protein